RAGQAAARGVFDLDEERCRRGLCRKPDREQQENRAGQEPARADTAHGAAGLSSDYRVLFSMMNEPAQSAAGHTACCSSVSKTRVSPITRTPWAASLPASS